MSISYRSGSWGQTDSLPPLLQLRAAPSGATDRVANLRLNFTPTTGYQVTVGKTLYIAKILMPYVGGGYYLKLGYCDNDVGPSSGTARTNPVMSVGIDDANFNGLLMLDEHFEAGNRERNREIVNLFIKMSIGGKFPFIRLVSNGTPVFPQNNIVMWGFEI